MGLVPRSCDWSQLFLILIVKKLAVSYFGSFILPIFVILLLSLINLFWVWPKERSIAKIWDIFELLRQGIKFQLTDVGCIYYRTTFGQYKQLQILLQFNQLYILDGFWAKIFLSSFCNCVTHRFWLPFLTVNKLLWEYFWFPQVTIIINLICFIYIIQLISVWV